MCPQRNRFYINANRVSYDAQNIVINDDVDEHIHRTFFIEVMIGLLLFAVVHIWIAYLLYIVYND